MAELVYQSFGGNSLVEEGDRLINDFIRSCFVLEDTVVYSVVHDQFLHRRWCIFNKSNSTGIVDSNVFLGEYHQERCSDVVNNFVLHVVGNIETFEQKVRIKSVLRGKWVFEPMFVPRLILGNGKFESIGWGKQADNFGERLHHSHLLFGYCADATERSNECACIKGVRCMAQYQKVGTPAERVTDAKVRQFFCIVLVFHLLSVEKRIVPDDLF